MDHHSISFFLYLIFKIVTVIDSYFYLFIFYCWVICIITQASTPQVTTVLFFAPAITLITIIIIAFYRLFETLFHISNCEFNAIVPLNLNKYLHKMIKIIRSNQGGKRSPTGGIPQMPACNIDQPIENSGCDRHQISFLCFSSWELASTGWSEENA